MMVLTSAKKPPIIGSTYSTTLDTADGVGAGGGAAVICMREPSTKDDCETARDNEYAAALAAALLAVGEFTSSNRIAFCDADHVASGTPSVERGAVSVEPLKRDTRPDRWFLFLVKLLPERSVFG